MTKPTRKNGRHLRVPVLPDEEDKIKDHAKLAGLSVASYLRNLALGYEAKSIIDLQSVDSLAKVNADLGRLGGLLKLWLTDDAKIMAFGHPKAEEIIRAVLHQIENNQERLREIMRTAVKGRCGLKFSG